MMMALQTCENCKDGTNQLSLTTCLFHGREDDSVTENEDVELMKYAEQLSKSEVPEPIRQRILAERMTKSATGVKVG